MKIKLLTLSIAAVLLASCGGGNQKKQTAEQAADSTSIAVDEVDENVKLHYEMLKAIAKTGEFGFNEEFIGQKYNESDLGNCFFENHFDIFCGGEDDESEGYEYHFDLFDLSNGGWFILTSYSEGCDCMEAFYDQYTYSGGKLTKASLLPRPGINDYYSNAKDFPKEAAEIIESAIDNSLTYNYLEGDSKDYLTVRFDAMMCDEMGWYLPKTINGLRKKSSSPFPEITYVWDGEKFIRDSDSKPVKEDINLLRPTNDFASAGTTIHELYDSPGEGCFSSNEGDLNHDGQSDLVITDIYWTEFVVYLRNSDGGYRKLQDGTKSYDTQKLTAILREDTLVVSAENNGSEIKYKYLLDRNGRLNLVGGDTVHYRDPRYKVSYDLINHKKHVTTEDSEKKFQYHTVTTNIPDLGLEGWKIVFGCTNPFLKYDGCNMQAVWQQYAKDDYNDIVPLDYGVNSVSYSQSSQYDNLSIHREIRAFDNGDGSFTIICLSDDYDDAGKESWNIEQFIFKDGTLTPTDLQPELKTADKRFFFNYDNTLHYDSENEYVWKGGKMVKK